MKKQLLKLPEQPDFKQLRSLAETLERGCRCCERRCGAERHNRKYGFCGNSIKPIVTKFFITHGEEEAINPARMLYAAGCNLRCAYCSNAEFITTDIARIGEEFDPVRLAGEIDGDYDAGKIKALQLLGGEPSCWLSGAVELVSHLKSQVPIVWNSNFYFTPETWEVIRGFVDFYVADFKFGNNVCSSALAKCGSYTEIVKRNLQLVDPERLIIRQLPLRGHLECCTRPILRWISETMPEVRVNFNELLPDANGICKPLNANELKQLDGMVRQYGIRRIRSVLKRENVPENARVCFSGEIILRPDGTVAVQDMAQPLLEIVEALNLYQKEIR